MKAVISHSNVLAISAALFFFRASLSELLFSFLPEDINVNPTA